ncbi:MAG: undecaprenyl-phosphate glucose phosphotransferase [Cytophagaceae bacterium]|jgi:Undecaprenyl-phosphate glucose phosphotransferase|nr:undecaprenyl-phosphate glucose phosphotransferase [Cytophagaceae bacterium]
MDKGYSRFYWLIQVIGDLLLLNGSYLGAYIAEERLPSFPNVPDSYILLHVLFNTAWIILAFSFNIYVHTTQRRRKLERVVWSIIETVGIHLLLVYTVLGALKGDMIFNKMLLWCYVSFFLLLLLWRLFFIKLVNYYRRSGANFRNVLIVGAGPVGEQIMKYILRHETAGYRFIGFLDDAPNRVRHSELVLGNTSEIKHINQKVDEVFCALPLSAARQIQDLIKYCDNNLIRLHIVPDFRGLLNKKMDLDFFDNVPVLHIRKEPLESLLNRFFKRSFDIGFSLLVVVLIFPWLFPLLALAIKLSSPGPVFFKQKRSGRNNDEFNCYKFRSMAVNKDSDSKQATENDTRITWIGKFLRKSNLDELPQFFNVLMGHMSVVGPRPHMLKHTKDYSKLIDKFMVRQLVKPGITGWAQVNGYRGGTPNPRYMMKRVQYDLWYIENWTLLLDIQIIFLTVYRMFKGDKNAF